MPKLTPIIEHILEVLGKSFHNWRVLDEGGPSRGHRQFQFHPVTIALFSQITTLELVDERQRKTRTITIVLARNSQPSQPGGQSSLSANQPERRLVLPFTLRRAELTRAEVMGRIGMAQVNQSGRYEPAYFRSKDSLDQINAIAD